ncbi:MAG: MBL fold metallo-hydrolase [Candidatus Melainabacteria bacterium]|nr:MAG: MBL fold metallo-hydrolase [Candidatus Melainabacteria bacterium]
MEVTAYGAALDVTGSCYLINTGSNRLLVDCGMFQGSKRIERKNYIPRSIDPHNIDAVILTHGHLDHCGRLPLLVKAGYTKPIFMTEATADIAELILKDSAHIQEEETARDNQHRALFDMPPLQPLYTSEDVAKTCQLFYPIAYNHWKEVAPGLKFQLVEAGHILGSACVEMVVNQYGSKRHLVFSGDLGQWDVPIVRDPATITSADTIFMESTYGDREHDSYDLTLKEFEDLITDAIEKEMKIIIPTFAVARAQQILYQLARMIRTKVIKSIPIYLDSPMAIAATKIQSKHLKDMDDEAKGLEQSGQLAKDLSCLKLCQTSDESKSLNFVTQPCVILAGAGMCNAGRIMHHLLNNLENPKALVIIVGFQARGSVGRLLVEGAPEVKIFGETVHVHATIKNLQGFSAHGDQNDLLRWLKPMIKNKPRIFLTHGETNAISELAFKIEKEFEFKAEIPRYGETIQI